MARERRTRAWWSKTVARYKRSGLTAQAFAAREGLSTGTLAWWSSQLLRGTRAERGSDEAVALEVQVGGGAARDKLTLGALEVEVAGALIRLPASTDPLYVAALVRGLVRAS